MEQLATLGLVAFEFIKSNWTGAPPQPARTKS